MSKIGSNTLSDIVRGALGRNAQELRTVFERLSSGQRINRYADDPAGLAIAQQLNLDGRVLEQRIRSLNDGISLTSIADQAVAELVKVTERLKELAAQAGTGTHTKDQRATFDKEAQALANEYNRIARSTSWNGYRIFDSSFGSLNMSTSLTSAGDIFSSLGGAIGTGSLNTGVQYTTGYDPSDVELADFNGDSSLDMAVTSDIGQVNLFLGLGDGTFGSSTTIAAPPGFVMKTGDVNGDSKVDLVVANYIGGGVYTYLGRGDGTFSSSISSASNGISSSIALYDLTGDGILDIASVNSSTNQLAILKGSGSGTFTVTQTFSTGSGGTFGVITADFNGDNNPDLITSNISAASLSVFLNQGGGSFTATSTISDVTGQEISSVGDFNNDGKLDFVAVNQNNSRLALYLGKGDGTFQAPSYTTTHTIPYATKVLDLNGDGNLDLAASTLSGWVDILLGQGDGTFQTSASYNLGGTSSPRYLETGDLNGDGVPDLVVPEFGSPAPNNTLRVFISQTTSGISALQPFSFKTIEEAKNAQKYLSTVHSRLLTQHGAIGSFQGRLHSAMSHLSTQRNLLREASAQITDVDIADESSRLVKAQVIQQFTTALLAQANQQSRNVLALLAP